MLKSMALKNHISFSGGLVAIAVILLAATANGQDEDHCVNAKDKGLCLTLVKGSQTWPEAMTNALEAFLAKANEAKKLSEEIPTTLPDSIKPRVKDLTKADCVNAYQEAIETANRCLGYVKNGDRQKSLKKDLSDSLVQEIGFCFEAFNGIGMSTIPQLAKIHDELKKYVKILSAIEKTKKN